MPAPGQVRQRLPGGRLLFVAALAAVSAAYLSAPDGWGGLFFFGTAVVGLASFAAGPLVHRPVNRLPWFWLAGSGVWFLVGLLMRLGVVGLPGGAERAPDLFAFAGYACITTFLALLLRDTRAGGPEPTLWLDTAVVTAGSVLLGWVVNVAPGLTGPDPQVGSTVIDAAYPVADTLLLTLAVQLGFRRGTGTPALQAGLIGVTALLAGDLSYTFIWAADPGAIWAWVNVSYIVAYAGLGLMAAHPSMRELSDVTVRHAPRTSRTRLALVLVAMLVPAGVPVVTPTHGLLDGAVRAVLMSGFVTLVYLRLLRTVQALQTAEATTSYRATHDALTGLPNRVALLESLESLGSRPGGVSVLLVDCDHFRQINDSWGHAAGDEVLLQVAGRLRDAAGSLPWPAHLARIGGDEFAVRLDTADPARARAATELMLAAFAEPVEISHGRGTRVTPSIGVAGAGPGSAVTGEELLRNADLALYQAKVGGGATSAVFDSSMHDRVARRLQLADDLRRALDRGEIHLAYQEIRGGPGYATLSGWEALARWDHPELGAVSPFEFIPIAEDTGVILDIGEYALRAGAQQLHRWQQRFRRTDLHMSVNVSSVQLLRTDVPALVQSVLADTGIAPGTLWIEITESLALEHTDDVLATLRSLAALGVKLVMDDFGTGYSSLGYLKDYELHVLKVDKAFVRDIESDPRDRELTRAMIDVAAALRLEAVVAEGVETAEQAAVLAGLGCSHAQGYLYARPMPAARAEEAAAAVLAAAPHPSRSPGP